MRRAGRADVDVASAVLADAFSNYPWTRWTVSSEDHFERVRGLQRLVMDRLALPYGEVWLAVDDGGDVVSVAVWMLPDSAVPDSVLREISTEHATLEGGRHQASVEAEEFISRLRPTMLHYYLGAVGTRRDRQGCGYGAAVLTPMLNRASSDDAPVYLETSSFENVRFYVGLGFVTVAEVDIPDGGPHVWAMVRAMARASWCTSSRA